MKIVFCPLVSKDLPRAIRACNSIRNQMPTQYLEQHLVPIINSKDNEFIDQFAEWCETEHIPYRITRSKGTPSRGKNEVLKFFRESEYDGMSMFDGDDLFYPSAARQIERHLLHHPGTDVLITKPSDQINNCQENGIPVSEGIFACVWDSNFYPMPYNYGPGTADIFIAGQSACRNLGGHVFYSKKVANLVQYDEDQLLGEDALIEYEMLKLHQEAKICFWLTFATDVQFLDRSYDGNIQAKRNETDGEFYFQRLLGKVPDMIDVNRSAFRELPVEFPPIIFTIQQKIEWIRTQVIKVS
jgi:hypothetical protein